MKNPEKNFTEDLNSTNCLSQSFQNRYDFYKQADLFFKTFQRKIHKIFRKIRLHSDFVFDPELKRLLDEKSQLTLKGRKTDSGKDNMLHQLRLIEEEISRITSQRHNDEVKFQTRKSETLDGNFSQLNVWKLKKKLFPINRDPPMAKLDVGGNLITTEKPVKAL